MLTSAALLVDNLASIITSGLQKAHTQRAPATRRPDSAPSSATFAHIADPCLRCIAQILHCGFIPRQVWNRLESESPAWASALHVKFDGATDEWFRGWEDGLPRWEPVARSGLLGMDDVQLAAAAVKRFAHVSGRWLEWGDGLQGSDRAREIWAAVQRAELVI